MTDRTTVRRHGLAALVGGALLAVYGIPDALQPGTFSGTGRTAVLYGQFLIIPLVLLFIGLIGLHRVHENRYGRLGRWSSYGVGLGLCVMVIATFTGYVLGRGDFDVFGVEDGAFVLLVASFFVLVLLGSVPLGYACYRARTLPSVGPLLLVLSVPVGFTVFAVLAFVLNWGGPFVGLTTPYGIAWVALGYHLRSLGTPNSRA